MDKAYTVPLSQPFLPALAAGLLARYGHEPLLLSSALVLLPTRRAARAFAEILLQQSGKPSLLLPRIHAIGDVEEDALEMDLPSHSILPPAISPHRRILLLMRLIRESLPRLGSSIELEQWATELARLMDEAERYHVNLAELARHLPPELAIHREALLELAALITARWPQVLKAENALNPEQRRGLLIHAQIEAWNKRPPGHPVIIAGSTGSVPATAALMECIAGLAQGAVVLNGFAAGRMWHDAPTPAREEICHLLFTPDIKASNLKAENLYTIEAENEMHEAATIALLLRETLSVPGKTGMLVTPDRALAVRVEALLRRWGIEVDDSAGTRISTMPAGVLFTLCLETAAQDFSPETLLAVLKHPLCNIHENARPMARRLEMEMLRSAHRSTLAEWAELPASSEDVHGFARKVARIFLPLAEALSSPRLSLAEKLRAHTACLKALAGEDALKERPEFAGLSGALESIIAAGADYVTENIADYAALVSALMQSATYRPAYGTHPRLSILSPMEARLLHSGRTIIASLNDGQWPNQRSTDWLGETIRRRLGLPGRDEAAAHAAQDFIRLWSSPELFLTRARYQEGAPQNPHAWLLRLSLLCAETDATHWGEWAKALMKPDALTPLNDAPACPPQSARPRDFSLSDLATLMRQPYEYYAARILKLKDVEPLSLDLEAHLVGSAIHKALEEYVTHYPEAEALPLLEKHFRQLLPKTRKLWRIWQPRLAEIAASFTAFDEAERKHMQEVHAEVEGSITLDAFTIRAKADRIAITPAGHAVITDYKTGGIPEQKDIASGLKPQLPVECLIMQQGGFRWGAEATPSYTIEPPAFWKLTGTAGKSMVHSIKPVDVEKVRAELAHLLATFDADTQPYPAILLNSLKIYNSYHHLARIDETYSAT